MGKKKKQEKAKKHKKKEEKLFSQGKPEKKEEKLVGQKKPGKKENTGKQKKTEPERSVVKTEVRPLPDLTVKIDDDINIADAFRALGDDSRLQILTLLRDQELCAGELLKSLSIVQSTLSHHMKILVETGIVKCRKQGKWSYYSVDKERLKKIGEYIIKWSKTAVQKRQVEN